MGKRIAFPYLACLVFRSAPARYIVAVKFVKEKLKPEKLSATFPAYILAYFMCMMTGFCMIMFLRELR